VCAGGGDSGCVTAGRGRLAAHQRPSIERFIRTLLSEWAYRRVFPNSLERAAAPDPWFNWLEVPRPVNSTEPEAREASSMELCRALL
jgi:hypothetical protein